MPFEPSLSDTQSATECRKDHEDMSTVLLMNGKRGYEADDPQEGTSLEQSIYVTLLKKLK
jgi:hypothetical protein